MSAPQTKSELAETTNTSSDESLIQNNVEQAKRAVALRKYEQAVEFYATALELTAKKYGDESPEAADLYFTYGKALLENAISQTAVLGKEQAEEALLKDEDPENGASGANPFISFSGDAEEEEEEEEDTGGEDTAVDLFAEANAAVEAEEKENAEEAQDGDDEDGEPEDDFNAAWECLDLARALFEKRKDEDGVVKLKLADTYIALGDVSLETEKFDLAIPDYEAGLALKSSLLPIYSRQIAEAHYKLSMVLDLTSGRLAQAISHAEKALESVESRLAEMRTGLSGQLPPLPEPPKVNAVVDVKGKGKGKAVAAPLALAQEELVQNMSKSQIEKEIKELEGLREDLGLKVEELKTNPGSGGLINAPELAAKALDLELNTATTVKADPSQPAVVNDLNQMVRKKKNTAQRNGDAEVNGKRKAEEGEGEVPAESKKAKVEDVPASP